MIRLSKKVTVYLLVGAIQFGAGISLLEAAPKKDDKQQHEQQRHMPQDAAAQRPHQLAQPLHFRMKGGS